MLSHVESNTKCMKPIVDVGAHCFGMVYNKEIHLFVDRMPCQHYSLEMCCVVTLVYIYYKCIHFVHTDVY